MKTCNGCGREYSSSRYDCTYCGYDNTKSEVVHSERQLLLERAKRVKDDTK